MNVNAMSFVVIFPFSFVHMFCHIQIIPTVEMCVGPFVGVSVHLPIASKTCTIVIAAPQLAINVKNTV